MTPDQIASMIDKVGVAITMLVVIIPCTFWIARLYIGAMNRMIDNNATHAKQMSEMTTVSSLTVARNTVATDNLSAKFEGLANQIGKLAGCQAQILADKVREKP